MGLQETAEGRWWGGEGQMVGGEGQMAPEKQTGSVKQQEMV